MRKFTFFLFLLIFLFINSYYCFGDSPQLTKVKLQLKWTHQFQFAGFYAAKEKDLYKKVGLDVEFLEYNPNEDITDTVLNETADFGISNSDIIKDRLNGKKVVLLSSIFQHSPYILLSKRDSNINSIHDIHNKKISIEPDAGELYAYLKFEGININKLNITTDQFSIENLINGKVDVISAYSSDEIYTLQSKGIDYNIFNPRYSGIDFYGDSIFSSETFVKNNQSTVRKFINASHQGWKYALDNKEEIVNLIYNKYSKNHSIQKLLKESQDTYNLIMPDVVDIGYVNEHRWKNIAQIYSELGFVKSLNNLDNFFYNTYITNVLEKEHSNTLNIMFVTIGILLLLTILIFIINKITSRNLSKRLILEKELSESRDKYRLLTENTIECIWVMNIKESKFTYISPSIYSLRGLTVDEVLKENFEDSLTPESYKKVIDITNKRFPKFLNGDRSKEIVEGIDEFQQYCKDGSIIDVEISTKYILDEKTNEVSVIGVSRNITDRILLQKKLKKEIDEKNNLIEKLVVSEETLNSLNNEIIQKNIDLEKLNLSKDKFFSILSHDLKGPIGTIIELFELIDNNHFTDEDKSQILSEIKNSIKSISFLLENLLEWSINQIHGLAINISSINISNIINNTLTLLHLVLKNKNITLKVDLDPNISVLADEKMFTTITRNILSNASKFTPEYGSISINSHVSEEYVWIDFKDNGLGMSSDTISKLFEFSSKKIFSGTNGEKGSGLGLIMCKEFIEKNNGKLIIESNVGIGTKVSICLPLSKNNSSIPQNTILNVTNID